MFKEILYFLRGIWRKIFPGKMYTESVEEFVQGFMSRPDEEWDSVHLNVLTGKRKYSQFGFKKLDPKEVLEDIQDTIRRAKAEILKQDEEFWIHFYVFMGYEKQTPPYSAPKNWEETYERITEEAPAPELYIYRPKARFSPRISNIHYTERIDFLLPEEATSKDSFQFYSYIEADLEYQKDIHIEYGLAYEWSKGQH